MAGLGWYPYSGLKPATWIPPQPSHTKTPTHIETRTHDQCGDTMEKSQAPDDGCINTLNAELNPKCKSQIAEFFCGVFKFCA